MTWNQALNNFCELYSESDLEMDWIIVGSVGSVLQQADMTPNDLDIYVRQESDVAQMAALLSRYNAKTKSELSYFDPKWVSSDAEPYFTQSFASGFTWTKGKWKIHDCHVEVVHISNSTGIPDSDTGDGIWEGGAYIWELARYIKFENHVIPVVPLEIQLESNIRRKRPDRVDAIIQALLTNGYDKELLGKALSNSSKEQVKSLI